MRNRPLRRLFVETLENRRVLTGNVTATVDGSGNLVITGDTSDNYLFVWFDGTDWNVHGGRQLASGSPVPSTETNVNGAATVATFSGASVTGAIQIDLGDGNDEIEISNADFAGAVTIDLGDGNNQLILTEGFELATPRFERNDGTAAVRGALEFSSTLAITGGTGTDSVYVEVTVANQDDVSFTADAGDDFLRLAGTGTWTLGSDLTINFGAGDDVFNSNSLAMSVGGNVSITQGATGAGGSQIFLVDATVIGDITITGAAGRNFVQLDTVDAADITITTGDDADEVDTVAAITCDNFSLDLGAGDDRNSNLTDITATTLISIIAGAGLDVLPINDLQATTVTVTGGDDADAITAFVIVATTVSFDTGAGTDVIGVYNVTATTLSVLSGAGNDGGGFIFGLVVGTCAISGTLTVDAGDGTDNVLIGSVTAGTANITGGLGSDGIIIRGGSDFTTATINTGDSPDVVGAYDTVFDDLDVLLGAGLDQLWLGTVTSNTTADLNGETDGGDFYQPTTNTLTGQTTANLTPKTV